jgi:cytochrome c-type biogenesis protein CcmH
VIISLIAVAVIVGALLRSGDQPTSNADRVEHVASRIRCPFCNGESIAEATSAVARDLEVQIAEKVAAGETDQEIYDFFADRYGESLLLDPPLLGWGWALWALPLAALLAGGAAILGRRRRVAAVAAGPPQSSLEEARLREQLDHVALDRQEIAAQLAVGELDAPTAASLSVALDDEALVLESALDEAGSAGPRVSRLGSRRRAFAGAGLLVVGAAVVTVALVLTTDTGGGGGVVDAPPLEADSITVERLEEVIASQPDVVPMRLFLARMLVSQGDLSRAAFHFEEVLRRAADTEARAWLDWIDASTMPVGPDRTARLEAVVAANPELIDLRVELGKVLADEEDLLAAAAHFVGVLEVESSHPEAKAWMGWIAFQIGEFESAESFLMDALAVAPNYPLAHWWLANVRLMGLDDPAGAIGPLETLLSLPGVASEFRDAAEQMLLQARGES